MTLQPRSVQPVYLSAGANRQTAAADWGSDGTLCFGAGVNIAVWQPLDPDYNGIVQLLSGHSETVKAVRFLPWTDGKGRRLLVSGGDDKSLKLWAIDGRGSSRSECLQTIEGAHSGAINCFAAPRGDVSEEKKKEKKIVVSGGADATIRVWTFEEDEHTLKLAQTIQTKPRYFPLCLAVARLETTTSSWILAAAGTSTRIQVFSTDPSGAFVLQTTLSGHEGWIRSLDVCRDGEDLLLASASQDKYVRLWRVGREGREGREKKEKEQQEQKSHEVDTPSNKAHKIAVDSDDDYAVTFEALLLGHDDWIYSAQWKPESGKDSPQKGQKLALLTASADNSLAVWEPDESSGIWTTTARLGELSKEKGATTATGSVGGFWTGLWSMSGTSNTPTSVVTLCRTGSWRRWDWDETEDRWRQKMAITGHIAAVTGLAWMRDGQGLLTTSSDQTTRLHGEWKLHKTWHEMSRPQIHGYDLNCIDVLDKRQFVSGADEKLMRVFREPKSVAKLMDVVGGGGEDREGSQAKGERSEEGNRNEEGNRSEEGHRSEEGKEEDLPDAANMPVLGLSNKAVLDDNDSLQDDLGNSPPLEDVLARHTLWPEAEKLYGHGYELSCLAVRPSDGKLIASACRASSVNHAVIRLCDAASWTESQAPLAIHALTVTRLRFSRDGQFLLSVGRDRQWAVFACLENEYQLAQSQATAHSRMLLDCAWAPFSAETAPVFCTAGRDKQVKLWRRDDGKFVLATALRQDHPVTAVDFLGHSISVEGALCYILAIGTEAGSLTVVALDTTTLAVVSSKTVEADLALPRAVLQLAWRPGSGAARAVDLAIAGADGSTRIYQFSYD